MRRVAAVRVGVAGLLAGAVGLLTPGPPSASATGSRAQATRLVFAATVSGQQTQIFSIAPSGRASAQLTFGSAASSGPVPSPDGTRVAFERDGSIWIMRPDGRGQRLVARSAKEPSWTPDSKRIAYVSVDAQGQDIGIGQVGRNGTGTRTLVRGDVAAPAWSPDGRSLAFGRHGTLVVLRGGRERTVAADSEMQEIGRIGWSSNGKWFAFTDSYKLDVVGLDGRRRRDLLGRSPAWAPHRSLLAYAAGAVHVLDPSTGTDRKVATPHFANSISWSPRGDAIAVAGGFISAEDLTSQGDELLVVALGGGVRNLVRSTDPYALPQEVAWTTSTARLRLRPPVPVVPRVAGDELRLREPVADLAADGGRVAYRYCGTIGAWTPGDRTVVSVQVDHPLCDEGDIGFYDVTLAGDRIAWASLQGGNFQRNTLWVQTVGEPATRVKVATGSHLTGDARGDERAGDMHGAGPLLAFTTWVYCDDVFPSSCVGLPTLQRPLLSQTLWRVRDPSWPGTCPLQFSDEPNHGRCEQLRAELGPLRVLDVDPGRIVVSGNNATLVLGADGSRLLSLPLSTEAAQLSGSDLVVVLPGALRAYDAATGTLRHSWPLPNVSFAGFCGVPARFCEQPRLRLEDAARGLVAYVLDGNVHLLRLDDGRDVVIHAGTAARFDDAGLVYTYTAAGLWPGRVRYVPFDQLLLR
jgi:WD40 repeat protein